MDSKPPVSSGLQSVQAQPQRSSHSALLTLLRYLQWFAEAVITKYHKGGFKTRNVFSHSFRREKSEIKRSAGGGGFLQSDERDNLIQVSWAFFPLCVCLRSNVLFL